jgi:transposase
MKKRKIYTPAVKLKAAIACLKGDKTAVEIAKEVGCHPTMIAEWKETIERNGTLVFEQGKQESQKDQKIAKLERLIGKLSLQNDFLEHLCDR